MPKAASAPVAGNESITGENATAACITYYLPKELPLQLSLALSMPHKVLLGRLNLLELQLDLGNELELYLLGQDLQWDMELFKHYLLPPTTCC